MLAIIVGIITVLVWLYLLLARGGFWRVKKHLGTVAALGRREKSSRVAVIVPARNEAEFIGQSVTSLLNQSGNHSIHIFLVDDGSTDRTADVARRAAAKAGKPSDLTVIP